MSLCFVRAFDLQPRIFGCVLRCAVFIGLLTPGVSAQDSDAAAATKPNDAHQEHIEEPPNPANEEQGSAAAPGSVADRESSVKEGETAPEPPAESASGATREALETAAETAEPASGAARGTSEKARETAARKAAARDRSDSEEAPPANSETAGGQSSGAAASAAAGASAAESEELTFGATAEVRRSPGPGETARAGTASRTDIPLEQLPGTVNVLPMKVVKKRGAGNLNQALYYVPGLNPVWRYGGFQQIRSRGFRAIVLNDGRRDDRATFVNSHPQTGLWDLDRIEVLKGPSAVLYGYGSIGGVVNLIRKHPSDEASYELDAALGTPGRRRVHVGATGPIADGLNYRLDLGQTHELNFRSYEATRNQGTLTLAYQPAADHRFVLRGSVNQDRYNTDAGIPTRQVAEDRWELVSDAPLDNRYNSPQDFLDYLRVDVEAGWQWQIGDHVKLSERLSYTYDAYEYFSTEGLEYNDTVDPPVVDRTFYFYFFHHWQPVQNQLQVEFDVDTGPVQHQALVGYDFNGMFNGHSDRSSSIFDESIASIDFYYPVETQEEVPIEIDSTLRAELMAHSVFVQDHLSLPADIKLLLGARLDSIFFSARRDELDPYSGDIVERGPTDNRQDTVVTYRTGLVYNGFDWLIPYASWSTGFKPNARLGITTDEDGSAVDLEPERGRQLEVGSRFRWGDRLSANLAGYHILKSNVTYSRAQGQIDQAGEVMSRGIEVDLRLEPATWLSLSAGYAYTDAEFQVFEVDGVDAAGNTPQFVPDHTASLWVTTSPLSNLGIGLGGRMTGDQYADNENTLELGSYVLADAALWYRSGPLTFTVTVNNALNRQRYFVSSIGRQLTPGQPRRVLGQLHLEL